MKKCAAATVAVLGIAWYVAHRQGEATVPSESLVPAALRFSAAFPSAMPSAVPTSLQLSRESLVSIAPRTADAHVDSPAPANADFSRDVPYFLGFGWMDARNQAATDVSRVLGASRLIREFTAGQNPSAPGCYRGGSPYEIVLFIASEGTPADQKPGTPWMTAWEMASGSFLEAYFQGKSRGRESLSYDSSFLRATSDPTEGLWVRVSETLTVQLFPKLFAENRFGYLVNVYAKTKGEGWRKVAEAELTAKQLERCH